MDTTEPSSIGSSSQRDPVRADFDASVVIPARNAAAVLPEQLEALATQDFEGRWEIIVVDNNSDDGTAEVVRSWQARLPTLVLVSDDHPGPEHPRNTGIERARSERILLCDADDVADPAWVRSMVAALEHEDLVGGRLEYERLNHPTIRNSREHIQTDELGRPMTHLPFSSTASLAVRKQVWRDLGGFAIGFSETDFCWRSQYAGFSIGFAPDSVMHYRLRGALRAIRRQAHRYTRRREDLYARHRQLGYLPMAPSSRLKIAAHRASRLVVDAPAALTSTGRARYWRDIGRVTGTMNGLAAHRFQVFDRSLREHVDRDRALDDYIDRERNSIPGWLSAADARMLVAADAAQQACSIGGDILEIGAYRGRSAIVLGFLLEPTERLVVVDLFSGDGIDPSSPYRWRGHEQRNPTRADFEANYFRFHAVPPNVHTGASASFDAAALGGRRFRIVHIDGAHDWDGVANDLELARAVATDDAVVVFDDINRVTLPAVAARVWGAVADGLLHPVVLTEHKLFTTLSRDTPVAEELRRRAPTVGRATEHSVAGASMVRVHDAAPTGSRTRRTARSLLPPAAVSLIHRANAGVAKTRGSRRR